MSLVVLPASKGAIPILGRPPARGMERIALAGLLAGLFAASVAGIARAEAVATAGLYAALTPQEYTAWVTAITGSVGALCAAANAVFLLIHRWGRPGRPRRPRKRKARPDGREEGPAPTPADPDPPRS